ncbi:TfoX/Sxy family protein [Oscillibacter sp. GMB15532]|uniref:TfoX/Sxy family protein n=1 Tax=Oscillibacter sp. GMB15532 TaxID=3230022 RepID=UPI0034DFE84F
MATSSDYVEFVCEQLGNLWSVRSRKMFGEYMVYVNDKPILLVCDNTVFVKILPELAPVMGGAARGVPYEGAKEHYILDIEDQASLRAAVEILEAVSPLPKARKKK